MTIKIGKISYWHVHAKDYTKQAELHPDTEIIAVWDEMKSRGIEAAERLGVPYYASLDDMLALAEMDAVIVDAPTNMHHEVIVKAAQHQKHIFTEKVIASTMREVDEIIQAVHEHNVKFTVSLPRLNEGYTLSIQEILAQRLLGDITLVRSRLSHSGAIAGWLPAHFFDLEQCQGGAMIDLGCHPMYLVRLFLQQKITSVVAQYGYHTQQDVEDNAVSTLETASGAIGIVEAGFVNHFSPFTIEVHGTEGSLLYSTHDQKLWIRTKVKSEYSEAWVELPIQQKRQSAFEQWVTHIQQDTTADENIELAIELTRLMEASNRSVAEQRKIYL